MSNKEKELPQILPRWEVPDSWKWVSVADVGKVVTGNTPPTSDKANYGNDIPYVKPPELIDRGIRTTPSGLSTKGASIARTLPVRAVLVSCIGGLGKTGIAKVPVAFNQQINAIIFNENVFPEYGFYYAQTLKEWLYSVSSATTLPIVNKGKFLRAPFPIAPLEQQKRIVAEIEKQFSRLDEAVANLKRVKANLKRYKAAVLKAAVEGKLTEEWRKQHPDVEPADKLLERILEERRGNWQGRGQYKAPVAPDVNSLSELPVGWVWVRTDQLFSFVTSGSRGWARYYSETGPAFLRMGNLDHDTIDLDLSDIQRVQPLEGAEGQRTRVRAGDILVSITADVGMIGMVPKCFEEAYINQHVSLARPVSLLTSNYIAWFLVCKNGQNQLKGLQRGATKVGLGLDDIRSVNVPLPPVDEQQAILEEIARCVSVADKAEDFFDANILRAGRLRQSILKKAFSGELSC